MSTRNLIVLLIPLVLLAGLLLNMQPLQTSESASTSSSIVYDQHVAQVVEAFGLAMKNVSIQSPSVSGEIDSNYGAYASQGLIAAWKDSPHNAPGRKTSSPWPARIQIGQMEGGDTGFIVHGTVVDVVNADDGTEEIVGSYPVKLYVQNIDGAWRITQYEEGDYSRIPARATIIGTFTCLPHRDTEGPQTLECAFGIQEEGSGDHYAVNTQLMASTDWTQIPTGSRVRVQGVMVPIENLSTNMWQKYDIVGIISATTIRQL